MNGRQWTPTPPRSASEYDEVQLERNIRMKRKQRRPKTRGNVLDPIRRFQQPLVVSVKWKKG
ncbi:hypothetical protein ACS0TY_023075 [Phlomoides rotata]